MDKQHIPSGHDLDVRLREMERWAARADVLVTAHEKRLDSLEPVVDKLADAAESAHAVTEALHARRMSRQASFTRILGWAAGGAGIAGVILKVVGRGGA